MSPRSDELFERALEWLASARDLLAAGHHETAVSTAYYAALYAARAALSEHDLNARSHRGLWHLLREHVVTEGEIPRDLVEPLQDAQELRIDVDYNARRVSEDEARDLLVHAERLVDAVGKVYGDS